MSIPKKLVPRKIYRELIPKKLVLRKIYQELCIENNVSIVKKNAKTIKCIIENDNEILWTSRSGIEYSFKRCLLRIIYSHHEKYKKEEDRIALHKLAVELKYVTPEGDYYTKHKVDTFFKDTDAIDLVDPNFITQDISNDEKMKKFITQNTDVLKDKHIISGTTPNVSIMNGEIKVENVGKYQQKLTSIEDIRKKLKEIINIRNLLINNFLPEDIDARFGQAIMQSIGQINRLTLEGDSFDSAVSGIVTHLLLYCKTFKPGGIHSTGTEDNINLYYSDRNSNEIVDVRKTIETKLKYIIKQRMYTLITDFIASEKTKEASKKLQEQIEKDIYNYLTTKASLKDLLRLVKVKDEYGDAIPNTGCNTEGLLCYREMFF